MTNHFTKNDLMINNDQKIMTTNTMTYLPIIIFFQNGGGQRIRTLQCTNPTGYKQQLLYQMTSEKTAVGTPASHTLTSRERHKRETRQHKHVKLQ